MEQVSQVEDEQNQLRTNALVSLWQCGLSLETYASNQTPCRQISDHFQRPATINSIEVHGAKNTRRGFLDPLFSGLVDNSRNAGTTLGDVLEGLQAATNKLNRFGMPHSTAIPVPQTY